MDTPQNILDELLDALEEGMQQTKGGDAIDEILAGDARTTSVQSLRDHPIVEKFRQELSDGLIRVDTAHLLLGLLRTVVAAALSA